MVIIFERFIPLKFVSNCTDKLLIWYNYVFVLYINCPELLSRNWEMLETLDGRNSMTRSCMHVNGWCMHLSESTYIQSSWWIYDRCGYTSDRPLRAISNGQVSLLTKQGLVITSPICRTFVDEATVGRDVKDEIARVKRWITSVYGAGDNNASRVSRYFCFCIIFASIDGCLVFIVLSNPWCTAPYLVENIGETINWRVCVRNDATPERLHPDLPWPLCPVVIVAYCN